MASELTSAATQLTQRIKEQTSSVFARTKSSKRGEKMLTCACLSDLFRRLDADGSGELDIGEFLNLSKKLKWDASEELLTNIFREVDVSRSGTVDMQEFIAAYQKMFAMSAESRKKTGVADNRVTEVVTVLRYGIERSHYLFEVYSGHVRGGQFSLTSKKTYRDSDVENFEDDFDHENVDIDLDELNRLIVTEAQLNRKEKGRKVYWWVDIAMEIVGQHSLQKYIGGLGLVNETRFKTNYGMFNSILPRNEKCHVYAGNGNTVLGSTSSLTIFAQTMWIRNIPIVHCLPQWLDNLCLGVQSFRDYYKSRIAFMLTSSEGPEKYQQYAAAYEDADFMAQHLLDPDLEYTPVDPKQVKSGWNPLQMPSVTKLDFDDRFKDPDWLLPGDELRRRPTKIVFDTLSVSILDQSHTPSACISIRQIENEGNSTCDISAQASLGILGRIITGVRMKIFENMRAKGITTVGAGVSESPASLASVIVSLVHNFSMNSLGVLTNWINTISAETEDATVSKHLAHAKDIAKLIGVISEYLNPTFDLFQHLEEQAITDSAEHQTHEKETDIEDVVITVAPIRTRKSVIKSPLVRSEETLTSFSTLHEEKLTGRLTFDTIKIFLNGSSRKAFHFVTEILDGEETLEVKGVRYWKDQIGSVTSKLEKLKEDMELGYEEKRNYLSFVFTITSIALAPMAILTGYWGMNFDNMEELNRDFFKSTPGVRLLWVVMSVIYFTMFLLFIHYRFLYIAT